MSIKLRKKTGPVSVLLWMFLFYQVSAQESSSLFFLPGVPQASLENPAIQNRSGKLAIGIPVLSGIHLNWNSNMAFDYLFSDGFDYSFSRLYDSLNGEGKTQASATVSIFFASLKHNSYTFSISVSERGIANGNFEKDIVRLIRDGIIDYYGTNQNLGTAFIQVRQFKELGIGVAKEWWEGFDIGIRPKLLFGKYFLDSHDFDMLVKTDAANNELLIAPQGTYFMSGPLSYDQSFRANVFAGDYFFQLKNLGVALDAGLVWRADNAMEWSVSLLDLGVINFHHNAFDMKMARPWQYKEGMLYQSHSPEAPNYLEPREALRQFADSISFLLEVDGSNRRVLSPLPAKVNLAGKYHLSKKTTLGFSNQFTWYRRQPLNRVSLFTNKRFGTKFELAGSLSLYNLAEIAPGIGASYSAQWMQFFLTTNNILGFIHPSSSKQLNLCLGMNFLFDTQ